MRCGVDALGAEGIYREIRSQEEEGRIGARPLSLLISL
jgi:hypothetical protein